MLPLLTAAGVGAAVVLAALAAFVRRRGGSAAGTSLAVLLLCAGWWAAAYALELSSTDLHVRGRWGDLKYPGIMLLPPAFLVFVLRYTGHGGLVSRRLLTLLAIEPVVVCVLLANPGTHDLIRYYKDGSTPGQIPLVGAGPLFWVVLVYANALLLGATGLLVRSMWRLSRTYRVAAATVVAAALLPWAANLLYNLEVGPFARLDLTPFAFTLTGAVLVAGLYRERLIDLADVGWGLAVTTTPDALVLCDAFGHVTDANPAANLLLGNGASLVGRDLPAILAPLTPAASLPDRGWTAPRPADPAVATAASASELQIVVGGQLRHFELVRHGLPSPEGVTIGELVILRDITARRESEARLRDLLDERTRIAETLRSSLLPALLPHIPGCSLAALYEPAGGPHEIAGDFYDVFAIDGTRWGIMLGDVSGKGAPAGALTGLIRYTVRTLAQAHEQPSQVLQGLNAILLRDLPDEQYCTIIYAVAEPTDQGLNLVLCLGGHHPPLLRRPDGQVAATGTLGTAPGLIENPELVDSRTTLRQGELLCLFTDGLIEAHHDRELFGLDRATEVLAQPHDTPQGAATALAAALHDFHPGPLSDDVAVLVISVP